MRQLEKEERLKCRLGELTVFTFDKRLLVKYFDAHDILDHDARGTDEDLLAAASGDAGAATGALLWSVPLNGRLPGLAWRNRRIVYIPRRYTRYFVTLKGRSFDDYLGTFSSKSRSTLKRKVRKFQKASGGTIDFREYATPHEIGDFYRNAGEISRRSYQHVMFDMGLPQTPEFERQLERAAQAGRVRGYLLYLNGMPVAYLYCPFEGGVLTYQYLGYLQEYRQLSPGTVLQMLVFERLFSDERAEYFDFTHGGTEGSHKDFFATDGAVCADIFVLKATASNTAFVTLHLITDRLSQYAGLLLEKLNMKRRIRSAIRATKGVASGKSP